MESPGLRFIALVHALGSVIRRPVTSSPRTLRFVTPAITGKLSAGLFTEIYLGRPTVSLGGPIPMNAGRPPSPRIEAADRVQTAFDFLEEGERRSSWKGVAWKSRFPYSAIRKQVELDLPLRTGDNPERRGDRADQTTRNGLKWLTSADHQYR